jgi:glutathione S-transferase
MKLYYSPASCAMSPHIVLNEGGFNYELERVDLKTKLTETGKDFNTINEQGAVPFLVLDNGETLTEGAAIVQYIADQNPASGLVPAAGTLERARLQEWLNYISTEMHKAHVPLFKPEYPEESKQIALKNIKKAYDYVSKKLGSKPYLLGDKFTVADAYLFTIINWHNFVNIDLSPWPVLVEYQNRVSARPGVQAAMRKEGLLDKKAA